MLERTALEYSPLFAGVKPEKLLPHMQHATVLELGTGQRLLEPGQHNNRLFVLLSGELGIYLDAGARVQVAKIEPGECVGELSVIDERNASAFVVSLVPSRVWTLTSEQLWALMHDEPLVALNLMRVLADRVRHGNKAVLETTIQKQIYEVAAGTDALTGLRNRRWMSEVYSRQIQRCEHDRRPAALAMVDIDNFKNINDELGHLAGDSVLRHLALVLKQHFRSDDLCVRYGGEEFCALFPDMSGELLEQAMERLRAKVAASLAELPSGGKQPYTISVGVAAWEPGMSVSELIEAADKAMYEAKRRGRNRVVVHRPGRAA
jgi:diguanylate cyclase (GGDEF)-like protein